jgi:hypothetical protein
MQENLFELVFTTEEVTQVDNAIEVLETVLLPKLTILEKGEKQDLLIMGDKSVAFVDKALEVARQEDGLLSAFVDLEALTKDVQAIDRLRSISFKLSQVQSAVNDSYAMAGSEAYKASLMVYSLMKNAAKMSHPGAKEKVEELSARFPKRRKKKAGE